MSAKWAPKERGDCYLTQLRLAHDLAQLFDFAMGTYFQHKCGTANRMIR